MRTVDGLARFIRDMQLIFSDVGGVRERVLNWK